MKYFTPDLLVRFGSKDDAIANAAQEEWDCACDSYGHYFDSIKGKMPSGLRHIEESYQLHDAKVRGLGKQGHSFVIVLQLDSPPQPLVTLTFDLVNEPKINPTDLPLQFRSTGSVVEWQYDELELIPGEPPIWSWSILLSNGWEVKLHFRDVQVQEAQALLPAPRNGNTVGMASMTPLERVTLWYRLYLGRAPSPEEKGVTLWVQHLTSGDMTDTQVEAAILGSPEAQAHLPAQQIGLTAGTASAAQV